MLTVVRKERFRLSGQNQSYRDLIAWQKALRVANLVLAITKGWPREERFELSSQVRRSALSVPTNIAEGQGRNNLREFIHHLGIAHGSLSELETLLIIANEQRFITNEDLNAILEMTAEIGKLIQGLIKSLRNRLTGE